MTTGRKVLRGVAVAAGLAAGACRQPVADPLAMVDGFRPFERLPYLQAVDTASAVVRWLAAPDAADRVEIRREGESAWRPVAVRRAAEPVRGVSGPTVLRDARLTGLRPGERVEYRVAAGSAERGPYRFRLAPRPVPGDTVRVLAFGDSGWGSEAQVRLAALMRPGRWDLAVHTGDIAYPDGSETDFTIRHFQIYRDLLSRVPFFPSPGNHDVRTAGGAPYDRAFAWPAPAPGARYYAFRWGRTRFLALDTTDERVPELEDEPEDVLARHSAGGEDGRLLRRGAGRQYAWLEEELEAASESPETRWIIVYMHLPLYSHAVGLSGHGGDRDLERTLAPLFERYGVDLVLAGHDHHYERTLPLRAGEPVEDGCGPVYVVTGGGGASRFARGLAPAPVVAARSREHHFLGLAITDREIRGEVVGEHDERLDTFRVIPTAPAGREPRCAR